MRHHHGDAGWVGVSKVGVRLRRYVISLDVRILILLPTLLINVVSGKGIDANGRNGGIGHSKTPDA